MGRRLEETISWKREGYVETWIGNLVDIGKKKGKIIRFNEIEERNTV